MRLESNYHLLMLVKADDDVQYSAHVPNKEKPYPLQINPTMAANLLF